MIPNICHFVFGFKEQNDEFLFCYYLAVYSAYIVNKPHKINFFYHHEPHGPWWEKLKKIPCVSLIHIPIPTHIGKKIIKKTAHKADWIRMNVLYQFGGVYLDIDTICVKPWKDLLNEKVVLATQIPIPGICNAIMMTEPKSEFFKIWLDRYEKPFNPDGWEESSIFLPLEIMITNFDKVTMKNPDTFFIPHFKETEKIFELPQDIPDNLVSLHLWESYTLKHMKNINDWNWCIDNKHTLYGKMMINLLENFIFNDSNVFIVQKKNFIQNDNNKYTCIKDTILRKKLSLNTLLNDISKDKCAEGENLNPIFSGMEDFLIIEKLNSNNNMEDFETPYGLITLFRNEKFIINDFKRGSYWDIDTLNILKQYINPKCNILEIGGHCGTSSIVYSSFLENENKVYVYEPQFNMFNLLVKNINQNNLQNKIIPFNSGVFCYNGEGAMNDIDLDGEGGEVSKRYNEENNLKCNFGGISLGGNGEKIKLVTVDSMELDNIGFIHCDAQGAENFIFSKALNTLKKFRPVILFENNMEQAKYLYNTVCKNYPSYEEESKFDITKYCMETLNYSKYIHRFNGSIDTLLIP